VEHAHGSSVREIDDRNGTGMMVDREAVAAYLPAGDALRDFYLRSNRQLERLLLEQGGSLARVRMLSYIDRHPAIRAVDLLEAFGQAPRTITDAIDALERDGLAARVPDPVDRRAKSIVLTSAGKQLLADLEPLLRDFRETLFAALAPAEVAQLTALVARLNMRLDEMGAVATSG